MNFPVRVPSTFLTGYPDSSRFIMLKLIYFIRPATLKYLWPSSADVAELADALDSKLRFGRFLLITLHCFNYIKTIDSIA